jgi:SOS-response transcriptional repressor LexA
MTETVFYSDTRGRNLFGFRVNDDDMRPTFFKGDIAVVNPNLTPRNGDYVIARRGERCYLRLYIENSSAMLSATNLAEPPVPVSSHILLGRVVERRRSYK